MSPERLTYLAIKDEIEKLPVETMNAVKTAVNEMQQLIAKHGDHGIMALALIGAEFAAKE